MWQIATAAVRSGRSGETKQNKQTTLIFVLVSQTWSYTNARTQSRVLPQTPRIPGFPPRQSLGCAFLCTDGRIRYVLLSTGTENRLCCTFHSADSTGFTSRFASADPRLGCMFEMRSGFGPRCRVSAGGLPGILNVTVGLLSPHRWNITFVFLRM